MKLKRITEFCNPTETFPNQYGATTFLAWLAYEINRFAGHGIQVVIKRGDGKHKDEIALVRVV
ncbi:MAG: hypothetical protein ABFD66_03645 [Smithella sp.]